MWGRELPYLQEGPPPAWRRGTMESPFDRRDKVSRSPPRSNRNLDESSKQEVASSSSNKSNEDSGTTEITEENILEKYNEEINFFDELLDSKISKKGIIDKVKEKLSKWVIQQVKQAAKIEMLEQEKKELKEKLANKVEENKPTYADILREQPTHMNNTEKQIVASQAKPKHVILIKGKNGEQAKNIQEEVEKALDLKKERMKIK